MPASHRLPSAVPLGQNPRIIVAQMGARMNYAVPRVLNEAGMLGHLFTDMYAARGWVHRLQGAWPKEIQPAPVKRLFGRAPQGVPPSRVTGFGRFAFKYRRLLRASRTASERRRIYLRAGRTFCNLVISAGFSMADAVYTFNLVGLELMRRAKNLGVATAMEQTSAPTAIELRLLKEEHDQFPGWEPDFEDYGVFDKFSQREAAEWDTADTILCGSEFVRDGLICSNVPQNKIRVVPYGLDGFLQARNRRQKGDLRVLFVGSIRLQKGIAYLSKAASLIRSQRIHIRAVGHSRLTKTAMREVGRWLEFAGPVPRSLVHQQYDEADVFVLPSICEGSARVCYEALASGLPVITTPNAGSQVRDGVDGFIVPIRNPEAIAEKLCKLAHDRDLLAWMSHNALERSKDLTLAQYGRRLVQALRVACGSKGT